MVTIKDVARHAGVAISTVSKVVNHYPSISEATIKKVNQSIAELGFVPNAIAAALSSKKSGRIALLININNQTQAIDEINMQYMTGAVKQAKEYNLDFVTVFFSMLQDMSCEEITTYFRSQNIAGIVICGLRKNHKILHQLIREEKFKIVTVDTPIVNTTTSSVWIGHKRAQYDIAKRTILDNQCKRVLYLAGNENEYVTDEKMEGMKELVKELDLTMLVRYADFSELEARKLTYQYGRYKDVVVCASDLMAIGAMNALTDMDIFRPVCGYDGLTLMGYVGKQMNTVRQNFAFISEEAVKELHCLMEGNLGRNKVLPYEMVRMQYLDIIC